MARRKQKTQPDAPLNAPDVPSEEKGYEMAGQRRPEDQDAVVNLDEIDDLGQITPTAQYEGELEAGVHDDLLDDAENLELLTELELRAEETDDVMTAVEEGFTYVPPIDPPTIVSNDLDQVDVASGFGVSALDEPYDESHHSDFLPGDDEMSDRVREALRADSRTSDYAGRIHIETRGGVVILRGVVADLLDNDNVLSVAEYVTGVREVVDELTVATME